jgi:hypothetical protein
MERNYFFMEYSIIKMEKSFDPISFEYCNVEFLIAELDISLFSIK